MKVSNTNTTTLNTTQNQTLVNQEILGKDDFLKLLVTQLRHQDPINPVDDKEFIAQLAQFSSLEQMQNLSSSINMMMESQQRLTALSQATAMIGKEVEIYSHEGESLYGKVTGVQFHNGWPEVIVEGKTYDFTEIVSIFEAGGGEENA